MSRIIFMISSMGRGGAERVVSILSNHYCKLGWDVEIVMTLHNITSYSLDSRVIMTDLSQDGTTPIKYLRLLKSIRHHICKMKPDVVVAFTAPICVITELSLLGMRRKFRLVESERYNPASSRRNFLFRKLIDFSYSRADAVVFQSLKAKSYFGKAIQSKSVIIGNPIELNAERKEPKHIVLTAGRLSPEKNQVMLINAFAKISDKFPEYTLEIYGEGELREMLENQIQVLGLDKKISLRGSLDDYHKFLAQGEIFVLPSNDEGLSNALLEAMLMGLPCIATACIGSDEVIRSGENGILIPIGGQEELTKALERLLSDRDLRTTYGEEAARTTESFRVSNVIDQWDAIIEGRQM